MDCRILIFQCKLLQESHFCLDKLPTSSGSGETFIDLVPAGMYILCPDSTIILAKSSAELSLLISALLENFSGFYPPPAQRSAGRGAESELLVAFIFGHCLLILHLNSLDVTVAAKAASLGPETVSLALCFSKFTSINIESKQVSFSS